MLHDQTENPIGMVKVFEDWLLCHTIGSQSPGMIRAIGVKKCVTTGRDAESVEIL
jgi:hypothetical protein